jgi:hypothetical protein
MAWTRLIRFQDDAGATRFGEPVIDSAEDLNLLLEGASSSQATSRVQAHLR